MKNSIFNLYVLARSLRAVHPDDQLVPGWYQFSVEPGCWVAQRNAVLDLFHRSVPIKSLEAYEFFLFNGEGEEIPLWGGEGDSGVSELSAVLVDDDRSHFDTPPLPHPDFHDDEVIYADVASGAAVDPDDQRFFGRYGFLVPVLPKTIQAGLAMNVFFEEIPLHRQDLVVFKFMDEQGQCIECPDDVDVGEQTDPFFARIISGPHAIIS